MDKADLIAGYAKLYDKALLEIGYGVTQEVTAPANEVIPPPNVDKPVSKSSRLWSWITAGGGSVALPFVDWKVQMVIVAGIIALIAYAIFTMPTVRAKFEKWIDALNLSYRLPISLTLLLAAALGSFFIGEYVEKQILLEADNTAFQNSGQVENEVKTLNPYQRCIALGGVPNECKVFMRGLNKATQSP